MSGTFKVTITVLGDQVTAHYECDRHKGEEIPGLLSQCIETLQAEQAKLAGCPATRAAAGRAREFRLGDPGKHVQVLLPTQIWKRARAAAGLGGQSLADWLFDQIWKGLPK